MVGNRSKLFKQHPDWVVHDVETGKPIVQWKTYGEFRWHKQSGEYYTLDVTHPDAFSCIRNVFHTWWHEWGCDYFKVDFLFYGAEYGPTRAKWHTSGLTRIEIWRKMAEMIRAEIGDALWLACGSPLWAAVGLADGIRIGGDVGVKWSGSLSAESLLRDQATRNFANGVLARLCASGGITKGVSKAFQENAWDLYHIGVLGRQLKSQMPPDMAADEGQCIGKGGSVLEYQAVVGKDKGWLLRSSWVSKVTTENKPRSAGVVRAIALADHCRWVSTRRWVRTCWKVVSICQRRIKKARMAVAVSVMTVESKAWGAHLFVTSRMST